MEIKDYTDSSKQLPVKAEEKNITPVAHAKGMRKKNKFVNSVIAEEAADVKNTIVGDVLIPALKKTIVDAVTNSIEMLIYGSTGNIKRSGTSKVSYRSYYDDDGKRWKDRVNDRRDYRSAGYDYDDLIFGTRGEAEMILDNMFEILDRYKVVTVADLYDLAGERGRYTDNKFGWTDISSASVVRIRDGFVIKLPRALAID